jgi:hypothetical protein
VQRADKLDRRGVFSVGEACQSPGADAEACCSFAAAGTNRTASASGCGTTRRTAGDGRWANATATDRAA